jgi:hypothetical protein
MTTDQPFPEAKRCPRCDTTKPVGSFYRRTASPDGLAGYCKPCAGTAGQKWRLENPVRAKELAGRYRQENPEKIQRWAREWAARNPEKIAATGKRVAYGVTPEDLAAIVEAQGGICPILGTPIDLSDARTCNLDHDHLTGWPRGVLHPKANRALGLVADDPDTIRDTAAAVRLGVEWDAKPPLATGCQTFLTTLGGDVATLARAEAYLRNPPARAVLTTRHGEGWQPPERAKKIFAPRTVKPVIDMRTPPAVKVSLPKGAAGTVRQLLARAPGIDLRSVAAFVKVPLSFVQKIAAAAA